MYIKPRKRSLTNSKRLLQNAKNKIPALTQTLSKGPSQFVQGVAPIYVERGDGCHIWDVDGNKYIDLMMGLWSVTLGYGFKEVVEEICKQAKKGQNLSLMHPLEIEVADMLLELNPWADMVRFGKNGSDVTTAAVKAARAITGRKIIARCSGSYHGWHDWYNCHTERNLGVPDINKELSLIFDFNNIESLEALFNSNGSDIACVILEGMTTTYPKDGFLENVEKLTHKNGSVLILDEIINGFRFSTGGTREFFSIDADIVTYGKGISNGSPLSAIVGKKEFMSILDEVFFSFTFGGEPVSLAAAKASLKATKKYNTVDHLWQIGTYLQDEFNTIIRNYSLEKVIIPQGSPVRTVLGFYNPDNSKFDYEIKSLFQQEILKRGILIAGSHALSFSHKTKHINYILEAYDDACNVIKAALETDSVFKRIEGEVITPILTRPN